MRTATATSRGQSAILAHGRSVAKRVPREVELLRAGDGSGDVRLDGHVPQA